MESATVLTLPTSTPPIATLLHDFFLNASQHHPARAALQFDDLVISYSQLLHLSSFTAHHMIAAAGGAEKVVGSIVPICLDKSPAMVVAMMAVLLAGAGYVNIEPAIPSLRKQAMVGELAEKKMLSGLALVQTVEKEQWKGWTSTLPNTPAVKLIDVTALLQPLLDELANDSKTDLRNYHLPPTPLPRPVPSSVAYIVYTSGSSGAPKGIIIEHRNAVAFLTNYFGVFGRTVSLEEDAEVERVLQFPSYSYDVAVINILDTLRGSTLCMTSASNLFSDLAGAVLRFNCTLVDFTATVSVVLFDHPDAQPREGESLKDAWIRAGFKIKVLSTGGEKVDRWVRDAWIERGVRVVIDYGPSETTVGVISNQRCSTDSPIVPIGKATGANVILLLSESLEEVDAGCEGEICVSGTQVSRGYVDERLNEDVFIVHPQFGRMYRTGDIGRYIEGGDGDIEYIGRRDGQVKLRGLRIEVGEIEAHLNSASSPSLSRGIVEMVDNKLVAFLQLSPDSPLVPLTSSPPTAHHPTLILPCYATKEYNEFVDKLVIQLLERLPTFMIPTFFYPVNRIPTVGMGKADRKLLRSLLTCIPLPGSSQLVPSQVDDESHSLVRKVFSRLCRIEEGKMNDGDSFARLGIDSIGIMRAIGAFRKDYDVSFADFRDAITFDDFARILQLSSPRNSLPSSDYHPFSHFDSKVLSHLFDELVTQSAIYRCEIADIYPSSPAQKSIIAASLDSSHYFAQAVYEVDSTIDIGLFVSALQQLVSMHDVLRTCFFVDDDLQILQVVLASDSPQVSIASNCEVVTVPEEDLEQAIVTWLDQDRRVFSFGVLMLSLRIYVGGSKRRLVWSMHHSMSDGWTLELLTTDLHALYHNLALTPRPPFARVISYYSPPPPITPSTIDFWHSHLAASPPTPWLSTNATVGTLSTSSVEAHHFVGDLVGFSKRYGITPAISTRLAVALAVGHHRYESKDVTIGVVRSGRDIEVIGSEEIIGCLVSVLPCRIRFEKDAETLIDLARKEMKMDRLACFHQNVTLADLSRIIVSTSTSISSTLFDILFTYQSRTDRSALTSSTSGTCYPIRQPPLTIRMPTGYAMSFEITPLDIDGEFELGCYFDARVVLREQVVEILRSIRKILDCFVGSPEMRIVDVALGRTSTFCSEIVMAEEGDDHEGKSILRSTGDRMQVLMTLEKVWRTVLKLSDDVDVDDKTSFASMGGDSIALMRLSIGLKKDGLGIPMCELTRRKTLREQLEYFIV